MGDFLLTLHVRCTRIFLDQSHIESGRFHWPILTFPWVHLHQESPGLLEEIWPSRADQQDGAVGHMERK